MSQAAHALDRIFRAESGQVLATLIRILGVSDEGELVLLEDQDRTKWKRPQIEEGVRMVEDALRMRRPGSYQVQAAIAAVHAEAATAASTDWPQIAVLYDQLLHYERAPVIELNRAVAVSFAVGPLEWVWRRAARGSAVPAR